MTIKKSIKEYLNYKKVHLAYNSHRNYTITLNQFEKIISIDYVSNLNMNIYIQYIELLKSKGLKANTIANKIFGIKGYLKYLKLTHVVNFPFELIKVPKIKEYRHNVCTLENFEIIDNYLKIDTYEYLRKRIIVRLLWDSGMRINELLNIKISDIENNNNCILINTEKSGINDFVMWGNETHKILIKYLSIRICSSGDKLFEITDRSVQRWFKSFYIELNINITPHAMRHGKAHHMLNNGARLIDVRNVLRHVNISSTQKYSRQNKKERIKTLSEFINLEKVSKGSYKEM